MSTLADRGWPVRNAGTRWIALLLVCVAVTCLGQQEQSLTQLKGKYEARLSELDQARDKALADAPAKYRLYLKVLEKQFIDQGNLEAVVAVRNETNRFGASGVVTTNDFVARPEGLLLAQKSFMQAPETVERTRVKGRDDLSLAYLKALEALKVDLTKKARIEEAVAVAAEAERMRLLVPAALIQSNAPLSAVSSDVERQSSSLDAIPIEEPARKDDHDVSVTPMLPDALKSGLMAFYPLNGTLDDISENRRHVSGKGYAPGRNRFGLAGGAISFDGQPVDIPLDTSIKPRQLTVCLWFRASDDGTPRVLIQRDTGICVALIKSKLHAGVLDSGGDGHSFDATENIDGEWHHLSIVFGVIEFLVYLDGVEKYRDRITLGRNPKYDGYRRELFALGVSPTLRKFFFKGELDNVGIWGRQLSPAEVRQVQNLR